MKNRLEFFLLIIFYYFSKIVRLKIASSLGGLLLYIYGTFSKRNKIALSNLSIVFPDKTTSEKRKILRKMWFHFGRVIGEFPHLGSIRMENNKDIHIEGINNLLGSLNKYKNCLFFSAHIGNWELTSHLLTERGHRIHFIYRAPNNKFVDDLLRKIRLNYGVNLIRKGSSGAKECIKVLNKKGGNIGMLIDQKMNDGIETNFFNQKVKSAPAIAKFALKYHCPIIPAVCFRLRSVKFRISYLTPITPEKIKKLGNEKKVMNYLNKYLEDWITENPHQWIWFHNRLND
jgi:KDO2-lipid IV(A) lauroyltransferase